MKSNTRETILLNFLLLSILNVAVVGNAQSTNSSAPSAPSHQSVAIRGSAAITGEVERDGTKLQLILINPSDKQEFQGAASVSVGASTGEATRLNLKLSPGETRRFPLSLSPSTNDQYSLTVFNQNGALVLFKNSVIKNVPGSEKKLTLGPASTPAKGTLETSVKAKLTRGMATRNAELPSAEVDESFLLTFEIESAIPIKSAKFTVEAKGFQRRQDVEIQTRANLDFKLPETLNERRLKYTLVSDAGQQIVQGEVDLDQLTVADAVSVGSLTFDRPAYAPGESARAMIELQGGLTSGYRLEITAKDGAGAMLLKNERRGSNNEGKSIQEFLIDIPRDAKGPIILSYRVFGGQTGSVFDSGERGIILNEAQDEKASAGKRLSP